MNDTLIFLVLAALALIFRWLTSQGGKDEKKPETPPNEQLPRRRPPAETEEERVRRFLEALGVPPGTQAPPPVRPRRDVTAKPPPVPKPRVRRSWAQPLPPLITTPKEIATSPSPDPVVVTESRAAVEIGFPPATPEVVLSPVPSRQSQRVAPQPLATTSLRALLRSRNTLRQAIILREIIGPPSGLKPLPQFREI